MGIKLAGALLERDVKKESSRLGSQAAKLAKAKSGGAGIGGILGAIAGVALAPFTGGASLLMAGIGGGLGAMAGSKIGGASAGGQESIMGGKFLKGSRHQMATDIAQQEGMDILMAAGSGMLQAGNIAKGIGVFKGGAAAAKEAGKGLLGQIGQGGFDVAKGMTKDLFKDFTLDAGKGGAKKVTGGVAEGGIGKVIGGIYGGVDKALGGVLPGGQPMSEGYMNFLSPDTAVSAEKSSALIPSFSDNTSGLLGSIDMDMGMGGALNKLFPGMDEESAAASMGMNLDEFYKYLQQASGSGVGG